MILYSKVVLKQLFCFLDQLRILSIWPPTPPLSLNFALSSQEVNVHVDWGEEKVVSYPETSVDPFLLLMIWFFSVQIQAVLSWTLMVAQTSAAKEKTLTLFLLGSHYLER